MAGLARWRRRRYIRHVTRHIVAANNWLVLGKPASSPAALPPLSSSQTAMLGRLEAMASTWIRLGSGPKRGLDRSVEKFDSVLLQLEELQHMSAQLFSQMQPYSMPGRRGAAAAAREPETAFPTNVTKASVSPSTLSGSPLTTPLGSRPRSSLWTHCGELALKIPGFSAGMRTSGLDRRLPGFKLL